MKQSKGQICGGDHKHSTDQTVNGKCSACAYDDGYKAGYDAAFATLEKRVENLMMRWNIVPTSGGNGKSETGKNNTRDVYTHRRDSERCGIGAG